jgi:hypothetical protein
MYVSVRTRYGLVRRRYAIPTDRRSPAQLLRRSAFARVVATWRTLADAQRASWTPATQGVHSRSRLGKSYRLTGYLLFIKVNLTLVYQGLALVVTPPDRVTFPVNGVGPLVATNTGGVVDLKLSVPSTPAATVQVLATHPRSAGVSFAKHFTILCVLPAAEAGYSNILDLFVARYGQPRPGTRIFIRTRQVLNGWADAPKETTVIVPKA